VDIPLFSTVKRRDVDIPDTAPAAIQKGIFMDARVEKAIALLEVNLPRSLRHQEIARAVNLSLPRLRALFKAETGESLARYQKALRMREARNLLQHTFLNLKQIMLKVGFKDESHFVRDFKRTYNLSPMQYRAQCRHERELEGDNQNGQQIITSANTFLLMFIIQEIILVRLSLG
jgi:transcriptional regulator GlxA family with amidase domain